jgi:hypothetical protein
MSTGTHPTFPISYHVDEAGDGVLFGPRGRDRLADPDARQFFMLGMIQCENEQYVAEVLEAHRRSLLNNPLYSGIFSMRPEARKTSEVFHAKDDHVEVRAKTFEVMLSLDFKFYAVVKDMRRVQSYVRDRNEMDSQYRYHPNELYDLTVRMLFKHRLHKHDHYRVVFARRGKSDRTAALEKELIQARERFLKGIGRDHETTLEICPASPRDVPCLQITDYCLWALQRCYEKHEDRFLRALWPKVSLIHDVDDPDGKRYGTYLSRKTATPDPQQIKSRWI